MALSHGEAWFSMPCLRNFHELAAGQIERHTTGQLPQARVPEWLRGFPKHVFTRNSNIFQQAIVERIQILPPLPAN